MMCISLYILCGQLVLVKTRVTQVQSIEICRTWAEYLLSLRIVLKDLCVTLIDVL